MATIYSDSFTRVRAGRREQANIFGGKLRTLNWDFASLPAGAIGDVLVCGILHARERVLLGREYHSALTTGAGVATGAYGTYLIASDGITLGAVDDVDRFLVATSFDAAGQNFIADTLAHFALFEATVDVFVACTNTVEAFATAGRVAGFLTVVVD